MDHDQRTVVPPTVRLVPSSFGSENGFMDHDRRTWSTDRGPTYDPYVLVVVWDL